MRAMSIHIVRGWKYTSERLTDAEMYTPEPVSPIRRAPVRDAVTQIRERFDLCRRCGSAGHYASECSLTEERMDDVTSGGLAWHPAPPGYSPSNCRNRA